MMTLEGDRTKEILADLEEQEISLTKRLTWVQKAILSYKQIISSQERPSDPASRRFCAKANASPIRPYDAVGVIFREHDFKPMAYSDLFDEWVKGGGMLDRPTMGASSFERSISTNIGNENLQAVDLKGRPRTSFDRTDHAALQQAILVMTEQGKKQVKKIPGID